MEENAALEVKSSPTRIRSPAAVFDANDTENVAELSTILAADWTNEIGTVERWSAICTEELATSVAVMVALWELPTAAVVALKVAEVAAAATVTDAGTVRTALVLDRATVAPPVGAAVVSVTVHVLEELGPRLVGLQVSEETNTGATRLMVAVAVVLL
jgi:hypothetical protein